MLYLCDFVNYFSCYCQRVDKTVSRIVSLGLPFAFVGILNKLNAYFEQYSQSQKTKKRKPKKTKSKTKTRMKMNSINMLVSAKAAVLFVLSGSLSDIS